MICISWEKKKRKVNSFKLNQNIQTFEFIAHTHTHTQIEGRFHWIKIKIKIIINLISVSFPTQTDYFTDFLYFLSNFLTNQTENTENVQSTVLHKEIDSKKERKNSNK